MTKDLQAEWDFMESLLTDRWQTSPALTEQAKGTISPTAVRYLLGGLVKQGRAETKNLKPMLWRLSASQQGESS